MLILTEKDIQQNYFMKDAIVDLENGLISKQKGLINNPHRTVIDLPKHEASALYMPSADLSEEITSVKAVTIFPKNPFVGYPTTQGVILLSSAATGVHFAIMNASYLTRLRTGALSGLGTKKLARTESKILGVIGTGAMAFEQVLGVLEVRDIENILLFNRTKEKAKYFRDKLIDFGVHPNIKILDEADAVVEQSDIVCCSTRSNDPVFNGDNLKDGTHINGVGSYLPSMREVDLTTIQKASKIVVDDLIGVKEEAGELIHANQTSDWCFSDIYAELSELSGKDELVRQSYEEITFFKSVGAAYFDLVVAKGVYRKAIEIGFGKIVEI